MKGEVFRLFERFVSTEFSEGKYFEIFDAAKSQFITKEAFVGPGTYPDSDMLLLLGKAVELLGVPLNKILFDFGRYSFPHLAAKMPQYVSSHTHPKSFLKSVEGVIHVEVKKAMKDSVLPTFSYRDPAADELVMIYFSPRRLYDFAEGLIVGAGEYFKVPISITRQIISSDRGEECEYYLKFAS